MQSQLGKPQHKLLIDVPTRWNSSFDMCSRYLKQQAPVYAALVLMKKVSNVATLSE
ncbi:hypothetical protein DPMN_087041 [Dreissena polymorpha]|uniref:Uncharacterized protein n=1 Tax=Dreissena polymorpha TaxID=45954 RepID=A0A9D4KS93_DREPO|nr:hypothetical protein DPMN_087041 [Dreissena polymorpha]